MVVADASVLANALVDKGHAGSAARAALQAATDVAVPDLADVETASVLRKLWQREVLSLERFESALADLVSLPMQRFGSAPLLRRAFALRDNISTYDAMYVGLAEGLGCELITFDQRLAQAPGPACDVRLLAS